MECCALLAEVLRWVMLGLELWKLEVSWTEVLDSGVLRSEVLMVVVMRCEVLEAKEAMATKTIWMRNDDRRSEAARLRDLGQQDAQSGNEQILVVGRSCRHARQ